MLASLAAVSTIKPEVLSGVDLIFVRELTGGIYFGEKFRDATRASDLCSYSAAEIERVTRVAARLARTRRRKITSIDKANVLETSRLWREVTERLIRQEFPDIALEHMLVDAAAMHLIRRPRDFDVLLTENMFGDILTDEASMLSGSLGMLPSASLGDGTRGLFEPIHGSAPDIAGKGIANPYGTILSVALLLRHSLGLHDEAAAVEAAVHRAIDNGARTAGYLERRERVHSTGEAGSAVLKELAQAAQLIRQAVARIFSVPFAGANTAARCSAAARSACRSSSASIPIDRRMRPSARPARRRASGSIAACVIVAGCATRLSTPPSDSASEKQLMPSTKARTASCPPSSSRVTIAPKPRCWRFARSCPG